MKHKAYLRWKAIFLFGLPLALLLLSGKQPGKSQENQTPLMHSVTSEVLLDFVARGKNGKIVRDLKPDEVQVLEDGVPQTLRHFEFLDGHTKSRRSPEPESAPQPVAARPGATPAAAPLNVNELRELNVVSVVIGNLDPRGRGITLNAMGDFAKTRLGPNTYVGVFSLGQAGLRNLQPYTNDAEKISAAVQRATNDVLNGQLFSLGQNGSSIQSPGAADENPALAAQRGSPATGLAPYGGAGNSGPGADLDEMAATAWVNEMQDVYQDSMSFLSPLRALAQAQSQIPGRKVILLFSAGLPVETDSVEMLRSVISAANRSNVSIYALDTVGVTPADTLADAKRRLQGAVAASRNMQLAASNHTGGEVTADQVTAMEIAETSIHSETRQNMAELAEGTGGALLPDTLDLREPIREAIESARTHYEAAYSPRNTAIDGSFRKIEVKVTRPGVKVFARNGYYAVPTVNGRQVYPFEIATLRAINTQPDLHQFHFHSAILEFRPGEARNQYAFVFQAPASDLAVTADEKWAKVHVCVTALIKDSQGEVVEKISKDIPYDVPLARRAELEKGTVSFTAPFFLAPGQYTIDTAAVDRNSMKASVSRTTLTAVETPGFSMSDVSLVRRLDDVPGEANPYDPLEARGGKVTPELSSPVLADSSGNIRFYAVAYPPAPMDATVVMRAEIWQGDRHIAQSQDYEVPLETNGAASAMASVPAAALPPGDYQARVTFHYKDAQITKKVNFTLAGAPTGAEPN